MKVKANERKIRRFWLPVGLVALYIFSVVGIAVVSRRGAAHKTEELLQYACKDLSVTIGIMVDGMLAELADNVMNDMGWKLQRLPAEMCRELARRHGLDEVGIADRNGVIVASSDPHTVGLDLMHDPSLAGLLECTSDKINFVAHDFHENLAKTKIDRKYLCTPFTASDGFILVGYDKRRLSRNFPKRYNELMKTWQFGETGCYVCADANTDQLLFDVYDGNNGAREVRGQRLQDVGLDPKGIKVGDLRTFRTRLFGVDCFCRNFDYLGHRILPTVSVGEFYSMGFRVTLSAAVALLVIFIIFCYSIRKIIVANAAVAKMHAEEDERRERDMRMAKSIQLHVMPSRFPPYPNMLDHFDIYASMRTAKEVGGDFYDFYFVAHNRLAIAIADVSGKGVPAAMFMMRAKTAVQSHLKGGGDIAEMVSLVNDRLCQGNDANMFVTAWVGIIDLATGNIEYVNAGHNPPIIRRADGSIDYLRRKCGPPLAAMEGVRYHSQTIEMSKGDTVFLYTDGVTEATNSGLELFGEDRLLETLRRQPVSVASCQLCSDVMTAVDNFANGTEQADDITLLAYRFGDRVEENK